MSRSWFEGNSHSENDDDCDSDDGCDVDDGKYTEVDDDDDDDSQKNDEKIRKFNSSMLKDITFQNAYFRTDLSFAEALFYTLVLEDLIEQNVTRTIHAAALTDPLPAEPQEEYEQLALSEAIAVVSLYNSNIWSALHRFLGYGLLKSFIVQYGNVKRKKLSVQVL